MFSSKTLTHVILFLSNNNGLLTGVVGTSIQALDLASNGSINGEHLAMIPHYLNSSALLPIGFNISVEEALIGSGRNLSIGSNSSCSLDIEIA